MRGKGIDTRDMAVGQPPVINLDGELNTGGLTLQPVDSPLNKEYMEELAFMEEKITVMVNRSSDQNEENPVTVGNNGVFVQFFRGQPTVVRRKFVDCLIVKSSRVSTPEYTNGAGERAYRIVQDAAQKYPITVLEDKNPKGSEWLMRRMAEIY